MPTTMLPVVDDVVAKTDVQPDLPLVVPTVDYKGSHEVVLPVLRFKTGELVR